jgi:ELWxxDGT repeat protein
VLVKDISYGAGSSSINNFCVVGTMLFFSANNVINSEELWKTNGATAGMVLVADLTLIGDSDVRLHAVLDNVLLFTQTNNTIGNELYKYVAYSVVITSTTLTNATVNSAYTATLTQTGLTSATWTVTVGNLPAGLSFNSATGVISGIPTSAETFTFTVEVTGQSCTKIQIFSIIVDKGNQTIVFGALPAKTTLDNFFSITAIGGVSGNNVVFSSSNTSVATISGNVVTILSACTTNITASQARNANYNAATAVVQTLNVTNTVTSLSLTDKNVIISPNPFNDAFNIDFGGAILPKSVINIYDAQGKKLRSIDANSDIVSISLENESNGVYFVEIGGVSNTIYRKIVKNN